MVVRFSGGSTAGPRAVPGTYDVRMYVGDELVGEQEFEVKKDPRLEQISQEDLVEQFELVQTINAKLDSTHKAINKIRSVREEFRDQMGSLGTDETSKALRERAQSMMKAMTEIEEALVQTKAEATQDVLNFPIRLNNKLAALKSTVATGYGRLQLSNMPSMKIWLQKQMYIFYGFKRYGMESILIS